MIGPYRLERVLGTGSFATVWLAFDDVLDRKVAVKILADNWSRDNDVRRRFLAEARVLLTVESPRIVRGFHIGESPTGQPYLVMAYADRGTVGDRIEQRRREGRNFDTRETVGIATEVAYALVDVHGSGHLHRDVKPSNVLIRTSSSRRNVPGLSADETVVLGDFGLARGLDLSALTLVAGSPGYVAPEQAAGLTQLDRRADLYPLGRMMLEMLTGDLGGRAMTMASAAAEQVDVAAVLEADGRSGRPNRALVDLITSLVSHDPDGRPSSAEEFAAALVAVAAAGGGPGAAPPSSPPSGPPLAPPASGDGPRLTGTQLGASPPLPRSPSGRRGALIGGAVLALAAILAVVVAITRDGDGNGGSGTTTTAPILVPDSSAAASTAAASTAAASTAAASTATTGTSPETTAATSPPESTAVALGSNGRPISTTPATAPASTDVTATLTLPDGAFSPDALGTTLPNPDRQEGIILMDAEEFAAALVEANPEWAGDASAPNADGTLDFEMTGFGRTASVHVEPAAETSGAVIVGFTIEYL
jgi:eukaryotic-like serine/threonine-protein kinase